MIIPVLWLFGPPGVGKTTVAWEIASRSIRAGHRTGYLDIDQLGMCYPEPADDPGRHRLKARNLAAVIAAQAAAGARSFVVSGVVDARHGPHLAELPGTALTMCRLRADEQELSRRLVGRQGNTEGWTEVLLEAVQLDRGAVPGPCVDTTGLSAVQVADQVQQVTGWPPQHDPEQHDPEQHGRDGGDGATGPGSDDAVRGVRTSGEHHPGRVLWLCGATGVGTSTVGFQVYLRLLGTGLTAGYVDLDQLALLGPAAADDRTKARAVAAVWRNYQQVGAEVLVMVGPLKDEARRSRYADALPAGSHLTVCRLHAGREQLTRQILRRGGGGSWPQPGDPLRGRPAAELLRVAEAAAREAEALDRASVGHRIDVTGRTVDQLAATVVAELDAADRPR